jgi:hypothetical protein
MIKNAILLLVCCCYGSYACAQQILDISAGLLDKNTIRVKYKLEGEVPGQLYKVDLYSSTDNFNLPLEYVSGNVGEKVKAGVNNIIDWDFSKELVAFEGSLNFEVRAELVFTPISMVFPEDTNLSRGKKHLITWKGTNTSENVDIQLLRDNKNIGTIASTRNDGQYEWEIPYSIKPGKGYAVKVSSTSSSQTDTGAEFTIRRKIPLTVKLIPIAVLVPVIYELTQDDPEPSRPLPLPPNTPN